MKMTRSNYRLFVLMLTMAFSTGVLAKSDAPSLSTIDQSGMPKPSCPDKTDPNQNGMCAETDASPLPIHAYCFSNPEFGNQIKSYITTKINECKANRKVISDSWGSIYCGHFKNGIVYTESYGEAWGRPFLPYIAYRNDQDETLPFLLPIAGSAPNSNQGETYFETFTNIFCP